MLTRLSQAEIIKAFGDPFPHVQLDGTIAPSWERQIIAYVHLPAPLRYYVTETKWVPVPRFKAHKLLVPRFEAAFEALYNEPEAWKTIDDFGGCYEFRRNRRNPRALSLHAWAIAVDMDCRQNRQGDRTPEVHPRTIEIMANHGFLWGGSFKGSAVDGMHFEFADRGIL